jgi:hypothetical protein
VDNVRWGEGGGRERKRERERERERNLFALSLLKYEGTTVCFEVAWEACDRWDNKSTKLDFIGYSKNRFQK